MSSHVMLTHLIPTLVPSTSENRAYDSIKHQSDTPYCACTNDIAWTVRILSLLNEDWSTLVNVLLCLSAAKISKTYHPI